MSRAQDGDLKPFPATRWTLVARAGQGSAPVKREALGVLLERYLPALRAYLVARRHLPRERVEDILQGFVSDKILEQDLIAQAQPEKGKFRSLLLVALNRYLVSQIRREKAQKRSPRGSEVASLGDETEAVDAEPGPLEEYDRTWAREVIGQALRRMQADCASAARTDVWVIFEHRIVRPAFDGVEPLDYDQLVRQLVLETPLQACNLLITAKRMFARALREVAGEYVGDDRNVDEELSELKAVLAGMGA